MAARRKRNTSSNIYQVTFEGGLHSNVRAQVINELIKYILYERQQMPGTFDQVKQDLNRLAKLSEAKRNGNVREKTSLHSRMQNKKVSDLVDKMGSTFDNIARAFDVAPEIQKAAIIIGATPVSPKEVYLVELPPLSPDADGLSVQKCVKSLFYQIISLDPLCRVTQIQPTNTAIMLLAPRHSNLQWFYPKPQFKIPPRGKHFRFQLQSSCPGGNHDISKNFSIVDLSGFEPLDSSVEDVSLISNIPEEETESSSSKSSTLAEYICVDSDHEFDIIDSPSLTNDTTPVNEECENDCSKLSTTSSKGSNKSYVTTSEILTRTSAFTATLSAGNEDSPYSSGNTSSLDDGSVLSSDLEQDYIWFQSPVLLKGYKDRH